MKPFKDHVNTEVYKSQALLKNEALEKPYMAWLKKQMKQTNQQQQKPQAALRKGDVTMLPSSSVIN